MGRKPVSQGVISVEDVQNANRLLENLAEHDRRTSLLLAENGRFATAISNNVGDVHLPSGADTELTIAIQDAVRDWTEKKRGRIVKELENMGVDTANL